MDDPRDLEALEVERDFRARQERGETDMVPPDDDMMPAGPLLGTRAYLLSTPALPAASEGPPPSYTDAQIRYSEEHGGGLGSAGAAPNPYGIGTYDATMSSAKSKGKGKTKGKSKDKSKSRSKDMSKERVVGRGAAHLERVGERCMTIGNMTVRKLFANAHTNSTKTA